MMPSNLQRIKSRQQNLSLAFASTWMFVSRDWSVNAQNLMPTEKIDIIKKAIPSVSKHPAQANKCDSDPARERSQSDIFTSQKQKMKVSTTIFWKLPSRSRQRRHLMTTKILTIIFISTILTNSKSSIYSQASSTSPTKLSVPRADTTKGKMIDKKLDFLEPLRSKYSYQPTFLQSVEEMAQSLLPLFEDPEKGDFYKRAFLVMTEPERIISFRVPWMDDNGSLQINKGFRVEMSSSLGPYKGGLRFHPSVDEGVLKFLAFEQTFKVCMRYCSFCSPVYVELLPI